MKSRVIETYKDENEEHSDSSVENSDEADDEVSNNSDQDGFSNAGWAYSISKILRTKKPKKKKTLVLSKAKKLTDVKKNKRKLAGFQVETAEGKVIEEEINAEDTKDDLPKKKKREVPNLRVKPDILEKGRERMLQKIATKGVVQLFNAVRTQQKDINKKLEEAGPLEVRKEKVLKNIDKRAFLDVLMGEKSQNIDELIPSDAKPEKDSTWNVLREDFMMGAKMKDWDKEIEQEDVEELNIEED